MLAKLNELNKTKEQVFELLKNSYITPETRKALVEEYDLLKTRVVNLELEISKENIRKEVLDKIKKRVYSWKEDISVKGINKLLKQLNCPIKVVSLRDEFIALINEQVENTPVSIYYKNRFIEGCRENLKAYFSAHKCLNEQTEIVIAGLVRLLKIKSVELRDVI